MKARVLGVGIVGLAMAVSATAAEVPKETLRRKLSSAKIRGSVLGMFERSSGSPISALVHLKEKADLSGAAALTTRESRGRFVYDSLRNVARRSQQELRLLLEQRGVKYRSYYITNMLALENATPELIAELAARADVEHVSGNPSIKNRPLVPVKSLKPTDAGKTNIESVGATRVWTELGVRGENIVVAGQDTGVDWRHPALQASYRGYAAGGQTNHDYNWHDSIRAPIVAPGSTEHCGYASPEPCDDGGPNGGHGTHTMGTIVGDGGEDRHVGMAPKAQWIACRNMDNGIGRPNTYIECFEFFLAPYPAAGDAMKDGDPARAPHVINNSWGCPASELCEGDEFKPVLSALAAAGISVVASAGNDGPGCSSINAAPAWNTGLTISVGALDHRTGEIASFSSRGPSARDGGVGPDVSAPGVDVLSTLPGGGYASLFWSGTSMAGPHVAGLVALIWSAKPRLIGKVEETRALIARTAEAKTSTESCGGRAGSEIPNNTYGSGGIDAYRAVVEAQRR